MNNSYLKRQMGMLLLCCAMAFGFSLTRCYITGTRTFLFLNWNLFLAVIPFITSITLLKVSPKSKLSNLLFIGFWLLFLPNAPYILTDVFHIKYNKTSLVWYDILLILTFALTGLLSMLWSLQHIHFHLKQWFRGPGLTLLIMGLLFITSFGVYLGRFQRWNSWDIIHQPSILIGDVAHRFVHPFQHPRTWAITIMMGLMLNLVYWSYTLSSSQPGTSKKKK